MYNLDVRLKIKQNSLCHYEVAREMGVSEFTFCKWLRQNKPLILTDYLSVGERNAITAKDLTRFLGWNERDVTITVNALRKQEKLICSNTHLFQDSSNTSII